MDKTDKQDWTPPLKWIFFSSEGVVPILKKKHKKLTFYKEYQNKE